MKNKLYLFALVAIMITGVVSCKKEKDKTTPDPTAGTVGVAGRITNESGNGIAGATVTVDGKTGSSNANGDYSISGLAKAGEYHIQITAAGYFTGYVNVTNIDNSTNYANAMLIERNLAGTIPSSGGTVFIGNGSIVAEPGGFKNADGTLYTGEVTVYNNYIQGDNSNLNILMPGGDLQATDTTGAKGIMDSYGFVATEFADVNGNLLTVINGMVNQYIELPGGIGDPLANDANIWTYNTVTYRWNYSAGALFNGSNFILPFRGSTFVNLDGFLAFCTINGRVTDCKGKPKGGVTVNVSGNGRSYQAVTNGNGYYSVRVGSSNSTQTYSLAAGTGSTTVVVSTPGSTVTASVIISECPTDPDPPGPGSSLDAVLSGSGSTTWLGNAAWNDAYDPVKFYFVNNHKGIAYDYVSDTLAFSWKTIGNTKILIKEWDESTWDTVLIKTYSNTIITIDPDYVDDGVGGGPYLWIKQ